MSDKASKDIIIIGGGPGGYVSAIQAAQLGAHVTIIEKENLGGTCVNKGCIPTKVLVHSAGILRDIQHSKDFGINVSGCSVDFAAVQARKNKIVKQSRDGVSYLMRKNKIKVIEGAASLVEPNQVKVKNKNNEKGEIFKADEIIIATGSEPGSINVEGINHEAVLTSDEVLNLKSLPKSIVIIGGGVIGLEFAQVLQRFGVSVTIIEMMNHIIPTEDDEITKQLEKALSKEGIAVFTQAQVKKVEILETGNSKVVFDVNNEAKTIESEKVMLAVGRRPAIKNIGLEDVGVQFDKGCIVVDEYMRTSAPGIYAIGDAVGGVMLAHKAMSEGRCAAKNAMGLKNIRNLKSVPRCIWTSPEVASVGLTEKEARNLHESIEISTFPFSANGKSRIINDTNGFVKVIAETKYGEIVGVHILGAHATELIAELSLAIQMEASFQEINETIHPHPTLSEAILEASLGLEGGMFHI